MPVNHIQRERNFLWSCSDDKTIIKWDLNCQKEIEKIEKNFEVKKNCGEIVQGEKEIHFVMKK